MDVVANDNTRPLTVADLLRLPALQLRLLAGAAGIDRRVSWAHVSELEDPTPWLLGAELLMTTGIGVPRGQRRQVAYLERLDDAGVAGLVLSTKLHVPPLHPAFFEAAERLALPVLEVPLPVPFIAIARAVAGAVFADLANDLSAQLQVFGALRWLTDEGLEVGELYLRLEVLSGYSLYLGAPDGSPLLRGVPAPPAELAALLPASTDAPPSVPGGYVLPVVAPGGPHGFLLAIERPDVTAAGLAVVQHIATVSALQLTIVRHQQATARREGAETLAELLAGVLDAATARRRLRRAGFDQAAGLRLWAIRGVTAEDVDPLVVARLTGLAVPHLVLRQEPHLLALLPADLDPAVLRLDPAATAVGVSRPFEAGDDLAVPRREAIWAAARAADAGGGPVEFGADAAGRWLTEDAAALRVLVDDVLGPARAWDAGHASSLVASLRTWLERDRRLDEAASALGIHPNTLAYRLRRFEALTGRSLAATADLAEVWLALRASEHVTPGAMASESGWESTTRSVEVTERRLT
jgi:purine catabolism regulator